MQSALDLAIARAGGAHLRNIHRIRLRVGVLSGVAPEALQFAFEALRDGTIAAGARLEIDPGPAACRCRDCGMNFEADDPVVIVCPGCHGMRVRVDSGREMELVELEAS